MSTEEINLIAKPLGITPDNANYRVIVKDVKRCQVGVIQQADRTLRFKKGTVVATSNSHYMNIGDTVAFVAQSGADLGGVPGCEDGWMILPFKDIVIVASKNGE